MNPWLRKIPWYQKLYRIFHCSFSMLGHVVFIDYLIADLEYMMQEAL